LIRRLIGPLCAATVLAAGALTPAFAARPQASVSLTGAGSSFDLPFFTKAFEVYGSQHSVQVNYQGIGSGAGIQQFIAKTVDFGATDVPMDPTSDLPNAIKAGGPVQQVPIALGGVSIAYNVPGVKTGLHLSSFVLGDIFLGIITKWNDSSIKKLNPKVKLPDLQIVVAHRSDSSGTSYIFTDYLAKVSDTWRGKVGTSKTPNWPVGVGAKGNDGVAGIIQQTPGTIGYVELAYVLQNHMKEAMLQNRSNKYTFPTLKSVAAAAAAFPHVTARTFSIVNAKGATSYPIAGYSWVLLYKNQPDKTKGKALSTLMTWMVGTGQKYAKGLDYVPLPSVVVKLALSEIKAVK
jgi:phosphate transport system substrate-binding protein